MVLPDAAFLELDGPWYRPTPYARGPWDPDACHGGPPTGAIARELEGLVPGAALTRLSVDLLRPVPVAGFRITTEVARAGRTATTTVAELTGPDGKVCARATALHLAPAPAPETGLPTGPDHRPGGLFEASEPGPFAITRPSYDGRFFSHGVEVRYPPGQTNDPGPTTIWMRTIPLVAGETPSPFQRLCPLADCGNALSRNAEPWDVSFINPDLTIVVHRHPEGEWLGSASRSDWQPDGVGLADALLFDERGPVGRALQTLVVRPASG